MTKPGSKPLAIARAKRMEEHLVEAIDDKRDLERALSPDELDAWKIVNLSKAPKDSLDRIMAHKRVMHVVASLVVSNTLKRVYSGKINEEWVDQCVLRAIEKTLAPTKVELEAKIDFGERLPVLLSESIERQRKVIRGES